MNITMRLSPRHSRAKKASRRFRGGKVRLRRVVGGQVNPPVIVSLGTVMNMARSGRTMHLVWRHRESPDR